eukprot:SAG31_NODE_12215_length_958_cov_1.110594_2_plen_248_part_01
MQVDLGTVTKVDHVSIWHRTDCCQDRLETAVIMVSNSPDFRSGVICGRISDHTQEPEISRCNGAAAGQYVTVDLAPAGGSTSDHQTRWMTICEIEIFGAVQGATAGANGINLTPTFPDSGCHTDSLNGARICGPASQSSIGWDGEPNRAIDGNTASIYGDGSCSHTDDAATGAAWFQLDLGSVSTVDRVAVFHRTDCCQDRLETAVIMVSQQPDFSSGVVCGQISDHNSEPEVAQCGGVAQGRYVTVD